MRTKRRCRIKCAEHLQTNNIDAELLMDQLHSGRYLAWFYEQENDRHWMVRLFDDAKGKQWIISKPLISQQTDDENLPIDKISIMC